MEKIIKEGRIGYVHAEELELYDKIDIKPSIFQMKSHGTD